MMRAMPSGASRAPGRFRARARSTSDRGGSLMAFIDRIGVDFGRHVAVEEAVRIAAEHAVRYIDCQMDIGANALESFDAARCERVRAACAEGGIHLGLH